jgi:hypothetical protein
MMVAVRNIVLLRVVLPANNRVIWDKTRSLSEMSGIAYLRIWDIPLTWHAITIGLRFGT